MYPIVFKQMNWYRKGHVVLILKNKRKILLLFQHLPSQVVLHEKLTIRRGNFKYFTLCAKALEILLKKSSLLAT